jgi:undecaprenyl diphosphate synthase
MKSLGRTLTNGGDALEGMSKDELEGMLDPARLPRHVAIIMDGNGRWAAKRGLPRVAGHKKGMDSVREVVTVCTRLGVEALTLYAFSMENWRRPAIEVDALMTLLTRYLEGELSLMMDKNIRFTTIGRTADLPASAGRWVEKVREKTRENTGMVLNLALSYGGRLEILGAVRRMLADVSAGRLDPEKLTEDTFSGYLDTSGLPEPDLVIRTSGERRVSNFLLWQIAYAELYFTDALWPDFGERELLAALVDYQGRQRRFGQTGEQVEGPDAVV